MTIWAAVRLPERLEGQKPEELLTLLPKERQGIKNPRRLVESAGAYGLLRLLAGEGEVTFLPSGKPCYGGKVNISLSHTKNFALCAVSEVPVGTDCERVRPIAGSVLERYYKPEERPDSDGDLMRLWCLKESFCKLDGRGIAALREAPAFSLTDCKTEGYRHTSFVFENTAFALLVKGDERLPELSFYDWEELFEDR